MYQSNTTKHTEKDLTELTEGFEQTICKLESRQIEFDMNLIYTPNWACIWNKVKDIGRPCKIYQKNDKLAIIEFIDIKSTINIPEHIYRLEDLSIV